MTREPQAKPTDAIDPRDWGKILLEDILFRAARDVSARGTGDGGTSVALEFRVTADTSSRTIEIATPGAVEPLLVTRLPLDGDV